MAEKFRGEFSPKSHADRLRTQLAPANSSRLRIYYGLAFPMLAAGLMAVVAGHPFTALLEIGSALAVALAAQIMGAGLRAEAEYNARVIARAPAWPRKTIGAILMGAAAGVGTWVGYDSNFMLGIGIGLVATAGMFMSFGFDPMRPKGMQGIDQAEAGRAADAIAKAEKYLSEIREMASGFTNRSLRLDAENLVVSAEDMFHSIEKDPSTYRDARRYLSVYLEGARDATSQYINLPKGQQTFEATEKYTALIRELDTGFRSQSQNMLSNTHNNLDIEIDVLRERLASEGIKIAKEE